MHKRSKRRLATALLLVITLAVSFVALPITDYAYISETTGSCKGHRVWLGIWETAHWYKKSDLESFMREKYPQDLQQRWTSYAGTGKNIWGAPMLFGHAGPSPIGRLRFEELNSYLSTLTDADKKEFYDVFAYADRTEALELANNIWEDLHDFEHPQKGGH